MALPKLWVLRNVQPLQYLQLLRRPPRQGGEQLRRRPAQWREPGDPARWPGGQQMPQTKAAFVGMRLLQGLGPLQQLQLLLGA